MRPSRHSPPSFPLRRVSSRFRLWRRSLILLFCLSCLSTLLGLTTLAQAQTDRPIQQQEEQVIREFVLPEAPRQAPVYRPRPAPPSAPPASSGGRSQPSNTSPRPAPAARQPAPAPVAESTEEPATSPEEPATPATTYEYMLSFNRSPVVGNRLRLEGIYPETRLGFTRPRGWGVKSAKALIRFQHSPALLPNQSSMTVRVNDTSIGSVALNRPNSQVGQVLFNIPTSLLQDRNEISIATQQQNSEECTDPTDPMLWTEVLPDSKLLFEFEPQAVALDFNRYPYPFIDDLGLDRDRLVYLRPKELSESWLTSAARFQASAGRYADFRPVDTRMVTDLDQVQGGDRLILIGTPTEQPVLKNLSLPFQFQGNQLLDGNRSTLPGDVGVLMMTTLEDNGVPVLVATGNDAAGVAKAVQFLVQSDGQSLGAGQALIVTNIDEVSSPPPRQWDRYLPTEDTFTLSSLRSTDGEPFKDTTVHGSNAPPIRFNFWALPDDQFMRGNTMTLRYSYSPQVNPRTSAIEVRIDGVTVGGKRLASEEGGRESLNVNLPESLIQPNSQIEVLFVLRPRVTEECGQSQDQQLWGTVHGDTSFDLNRQNAVQLPDLRLLQTGFPLAAPQDLSSTAAVLPDAPNDYEVMTLLKLSERLGRVSRADSVKLNVYQANSVPAEVREQKNLVGIGIRDRFPIPEAFAANSGGLKLGEFFSRQRNNNQLQTLSDEEGVIKSVISPWNAERILLALTAQSNQGLDRVQEMFANDPLFFQFQGDTVLVAANQPNPSPYDATGYNLEFLQQTNQRRIEQTNLLGRATRFLQDNWFLLPTGIVVAALMLYGISQLYINRIASGGAR
ncbi:cellulose biosynthesis cyclic di-GMP-binding regulatory protein BcsB [Leptolyngbya sp. FACHB-671]|uniref:cellulose biosynthesis cyclic di-GMP-binding regulatory protein BcsB n=1 Tax=Leptolyngbya sp. FACHB-671 TaxID=2692812 RepID=UPI001684F40E|nr:cellulose biosynthesis cyclic di-GMP-binding regulatory protein BcsB [Leptolyngbya sp. FACHB-671]MBD2069464.1 cellulose biosynthesis cyclic di-GMP-binding regulatory protein BcsB [Leptolyngbya sp. FACHB-671]